jgi:hypothetical protein
VDGIEYVDGTDQAAGAARPELDFDTVTALGRTPPNQLKACVIGVNCPPPSTPLHRTRLEWKTPNIGPVSLYTVYRVRGTVVDAGSAVVTVGTTSTLSLVDPEELPNGQAFTYWVKATFPDSTVSGPSNFATITAVNDAPVAINDSYTTVAGTALVLTPRGPLTNDTDVDSAAASLRAVLDGGPSFGSLVLSADGSLTYTPDAGFVGTDTFTYRANNGMWSVDPTIPMSADSNAATVSVTVTSSVVAQYLFNGYLAPLKIAGSDASPSFSGSFQIGKGIPIKWKLTLAGQVVSDLAALRSIHAVRNSDCAGLPDQTPPIPLYDVLTGPAGNSTYRVDSGGGHFIFNWDTSQIQAKACYSLQLRLEDGSAPKVTIVQMK